MILKIGRLVMLACMWLAGYEDATEREKIRVWTKLYTR